MSLHTHVNTTQSTYTHTQTHLNAGLHGDCFGAYVNLPPASVSVCSLCKKKKNTKHNYLFITTWVFSFSTKHSPSTINEHNKYQTNTRSKHPLLSFEAHNVLLKPVLVLLRTAEDTIHMLAIDAHHQHSHQHTVQVEGLHFSQGGRPVCSAPKWQFKAPSPSGG